MYVAQPIEWTDRGVIMLDQRRLPGEEISQHLHRLREVARAIREMVIRALPPGVAAAMGVALAFCIPRQNPSNELRAEFPQSATSSPKRVLPPSTYSGRSNE